MMQTPELRAATAGIEAAIEAYRVAFRAAYPDATHGILGDWIVVAAETVPDMDSPDDDETAYCIMMSNGGIAWYRARGLLQAGVEFIGVPS